MTSSGTAFEKMQVQPTWSGQLQGRLIKGWNDMPIDVLGKIFTKVSKDPKLRCQAIPLVSRSWLAAHRRHPPKPTWWRCVTPVARRGVQGLQQFADCLEDLCIYGVGYPENQDVRLSDVENQVHIWHALSVACAAMPNLQRLHVTDIHEDGCAELLVRLSLFSRLKSLCLENFRFPTRKSHMNFGHLIGLHSLEELSLRGMWLDMAAPGHFSRMWQALSKLPKLRSLHYQTGDGTIPADLMDIDITDPRMLFFNKMYLMTQIKKLKLGVIKPEVPQGYFLPTSLGRLTQVTKLDFEYHNTDEGGYEALGHLTQLRDLTLRFGHYHKGCSGGRLHSIGPFLPPYMLTRLSVQKFTKAGSYYKDRLGRFLEGAGPALANLEVLELENMKLRHFPDTLAQQLWHLTALSLSGNRFTAVPEALSKITTLRKLNLDGNEYLRVEASDRDILAALPLTDLKLPSEDADCDMPSP